jgi:hypothetical protein
MFAAVLLLIVIVAFVWHSIVPSFNPAVALRTLRHADDVEAIIEAATTSALQPGVDTPVKMDVRLVFDYSDTCIVVYVENDHGNRVAHTYLFMSSAEAGVWGLDAAYTVPDPPLFPSPPDDFTCD